MLCCNVTMKHKHTHTHARTHTHTHGEDMHDAIHMTCALTQHILTSCMLKSYVMNVSPMLCCNVTMKHKHTFLNKRYGWTRRDARPMSVPTTWAMTHANDKQHGTQRRNNKGKKQTHWWAKQKQSETRLRQIMFSGDGQRKVILNITPGSGS